MVAAPSRDTSDARRNTEAVTEQADRLRQRAEPRCLSGTSQDTMSQDTCFTAPAPYGLNACEGEQLLSALRDAEWSSAQLPEGAKRTHAWVQVRALSSILFASCSKQMRRTGFRPRASGL